MRNVPLSPTEVGINYKKDKRNIVKISGYYHGGIHLFSDPYSYYVYKRISSVSRTTEAVSCELYEIAYLLYITDPFKDLDDEGIPFTEAYTAPY